MTDPSIADKRRAFRKPRERAGFVIPRRPKS